MEITINEQSDRMVVALCGDFDSASCVEAEKSFEPLVKQLDFDLVVDCQQLNYICSTGLRLLLMLYKHQRDIGRRAILIHMNEDVRDVLYLGGYFSLYEVEE